MAAVSVIVMATRPVAVVGKMLEHQVEQLHRLCDFLFRHGLTAPREGPPNHHQRGRRHPWAAQTVVLAGTFGVETVNLPKSSEARSTGCPHATSSNTTPQTALVTPPIIWGPTCSFSKNARLSSKVTKG
jgi:hypothetical protein